MRDLQADLEICNNATPGPWHWTPEEIGCDAGTGWWGEPPSVILPQVMGNINGKGFVVWSNDDAGFIAASREGWPHAIERALKAEAEVERLKEEAHQDIEWLYKEYVLEADVNLSQDAIDLKRKLRDMVCKELQAENAQLRAVVDAARGVFLGEGEYLCSEFKNDIDRLRQALAELDKESSHG